MMFARVGIISRFLLAITLGKTLAHATQMSGLNLFITYKTILLISRVSINQGQQIDIIQFTRRQWKRITYFSQSILVEQSQGCWSSYKAIITFICTQTSTNGQDFGKQRTPHPLSASPNPTLLVCGFVRFLMIL